MRKFLVIPLSAAILLSASGCGSNSTPAAASASIGSGSSDSAQTAAASDELSDSDISVQVSDLESNINQWHHFAVNVGHNTKKYLTAEVHVDVRDAQGTELGETTVFVNNLGSLPTDWVSEPFVAKQSETYDFDYQIVSYKFTDGFEPTPEITDENVYDYLRLTTEDLGDTLNSDKEITAVIHNLTSNYFGGTIVFTVKDSSGTEIKEISKDFSNVKPYTTGESLLFFPIIDDYTIDYQIQSYNFTDSPTA